MFVPFHKCPNSHKYIYIFFVSSCSQEKASSKHNLMQENILTETLWPAAGYIVSLQTKQQLKKRLSNVSQVCRGDLGALFSLLLKISCLKRAVKAWRVLQNFHDLTEIETENIFYGREIFHSIVFPNAFMIEHFPFLSWFQVRLEVK